MRVAILFLTALLAGCDNPIITIDLKGQPNIPAQPAPPRFQLVMHPEYPGEFTYLLDTQTGAIWSPVVSSDLEGKPTVWVEEEFLNPVVASSAQSPMSHEMFTTLHPPKPKEEEKK